MKLEGRIWKSRDSRFWLAQVVTQGKSRAFATPTRGLADRTYSGAYRPRRR
jgi:hypothetical protein